MAGPACIFILPRWFLTQVMFLQGDGSDFLLVLVEETCGSAGSPCRAPLCRALSPPARITLLAPPGQADACSAPGEQQGEGQRNLLLGASAGARTGSTQAGGGWNGWTETGAQQRVVGGLAETQGSGSLCAGAQSCPAHLQITPLA